MASDRQTNGKAPDAAPPDFQLLTPPVARHPAAGARQRARVEPRFEMPAPMPADRETPLETVLLTLLGRGGKTIGKGTLLLALGVDEASLDVALAALIRSRDIVQRSARGMIGYALADPKQAGRAPGAFQPSLFGKEP
jgi:hypothetical protein